MVRTERTIASSCAMEVSGVAVAKGVGVGVRVGAGTGAGAGAGAGGCESSATFSSSCVIFFSNCSSLVEGLGRRAEFMWPMCDGGACPAALFEEDPGPDV